MAKGRQLSMGWRRTALDTVIGFAILAVIAEIVLRFLPVSDGPWVMPVNAAQPVFRFEPNESFTYSEGWSLRLANSGHVNNEGFISDIDYAASPGGIVAVIGDSQVAAPMVPTSLTFSRRLSASGGPHVYSFAAPGAALSQYLFWASYVRDRFRPSAMIFSIVANDFDESFARYHHNPSGQHLFQRGDGGSLSLQRIDFKPSPWRSAIRWSAVARYLTFNYGLLDRLAAWLRPRAATAAPLAQYTDPTLDPRRVADSFDGIDAFFRLLPAMSGLSPAAVLFVVDGARRPAELPSIDGGYYGAMRRRFMQRAESLGYGVVDLQEPLLAQTRAGRPIDFPSNGHWNAEGHRVVADAIAASAVWQRIVRH